MLKERTVFKMRNIHDFIWNTFKNACVIVESQKVGIESACPLPKFLKPFIYEIIGLNICINTRN